MSASTLEVPFAVARLLSLSGQVVDAAEKLREEREELLRLIVKQSAARVGLEPQPQEVPA